MFADDFLDMLVDTVTVQKLTKRADDGQPVWGATTPYPSRINYETHNVIGPNNQLVTASGVIWMACADPVSADDKITFPDGSLPTILKVAQGSDENGVAFTKLSFQ